MAKVLKIDLAGRRAEFQLLAGLDGNLPEYYLPEQLTHPPIIVTHAEVLSTDEGTLVAFAEFVQFGGLTQEGDVVIDIGAGVGSALIEGETSRVLYTIDGDFLVTAESPEDPADLTREDVTVLTRFDCALADQ